jgi:DNA-binding MarR family transcriptional regulator
VLQNQRKLMESLEQERKKTQQIEERMERLEQSTSPKSPVGTKIPPALFRVLKGLSDLNTPSDAKAVAKNVGISKNLASGYLNRLVGIGYVSKEPNFDRSINARYVFSTKTNDLPEDIKRILSKYEKA